MNDPLATQSVPVPDPVHDGRHKLRELPLERESMPYIQRYHRRLVKRGVEGYSFAARWEGYRHDAFLGYVMSTYSAMLVPRTQRGDTMFTTWVKRASAQVRDLDSVSLPS
jgi:hypothetical protein